jgi:ferredoxin
MTTKTPPQETWTKPAQKAFSTRVVARPQRSFQVQSYVPAFMKGMAITMRHFFKNTKEMALGTRPDPVTEGLNDGVTTIQYPEQKRPYPERFRGLHRLTLRDDGSPRCVACLCCSTACPAQCIHIEAGEYPEGDKRRGYERYPVRSSSTSCAASSAASASRPAPATPSAWTPGCTRCPTTRAISSSTTASCSWASRRATGRSSARTPGTSRATPRTRASIAIT